MSRSPGIGTLGEHSLHAALKRWYAKPGDRLEVQLDGYVIDLVRGNLLIEIQTRQIGALKRKLNKLLEAHTVRLVHPISAEKWIVRVGADGETVLSRRRSPRRGDFRDIFDELVYAPTLLKHPNLTLEILLVREEEVRRVRGRTESPARRTRFPREWDRHDHRLVDVLDRKVIRHPRDLYQFLPRGLPEAFTNSELADVMGLPYHRAQTMTYVLRALDLLEITGKKGNARVYQLPTRKRWRR